MTGALFDIGPGERLFERVPVQPCGCPVGEGRRCPPPWVDEADWRAAQRESSARSGRMWGQQTAPSGASTPTEGLTRDLPTQEGART